jgi:peptidoglycan/xylan/chitin deacetylase (PgdA/CDA1 family)
MILKFTKKYFKWVFGTLVFYFGGVCFLKWLFRSKPVLIILNYHNFSKYNNFKIKRGNILETGYAYNFEKQIQFYKKHFKFCYPEDFYSGKCNKGINILITFDDGYKDNYDIALPILKRHNASAVFFITTDVIVRSDFLIHDKIRFLTQNKLIPISFNEFPSQIYLGVKNYDAKNFDFINDTFEKHKPDKRIMMNNNEIKDIFDSGFKLGNHTHNHLALSFYMQDDQLKNIQEANNILYSIIGKYPSHFAFPNGLSNEDTIDTLKNLGFKFGYSINGGFNDWSTDKLNLMRIGINVSDSIGTILLKLILFTTIKKGKIK